MTTPATDSKEIVYALYHRVVIMGLTLRFSKLSGLSFKGPTPKLDFNTCHIRMVMIDVTLAMVTWRYLVKQGILPPDIMK